jgi:hypothetical protein
MPSFFGLKQTIGGFFSHFSKIVYGEGRSEYRENGIQFQWRGVEWAASYRLPASSENPLVAQTDGSAHNSMP